jgi:hypothetical protein
MGPKLLFHYKASWKSCISSIVMTNRADPHPVGYGPDGQEARPIGPFWAIVILPYHNGHGPRHDRPF